jgi:hypothetical protein
VRPNCVSRARTAPKASRKILFNQTTNTTLSGSFSGANLVKTGSGTLTVNGSNTHTGTLGGSSQIIINNGSSFLVIADATGLDAYLNGISFYSGSGTGLSENGFDQGFSGIGTEIIAVLETETYFYAVALPNRPLHPIHPLPSQAKALEESSSRFCDPRCRSSARSFTKGRRAVGVRLTRQGRHFIPKKP